MIYKTISESSNIFPISLSDKVLVATIGLLRDRKRKKKNFPSEKVIFPQKRVFHKKKNFVFQFSVGKCPESIDTTCVDPIIGLIVCEIF